MNGLVFNGSFSRLANFYRVADIFSFYDYSLDKHTVYGGSFEESKNRYLSGNYDSSRGVTHYEAFYPFPSRVIFNDNNTGHNLLIIGDSFARAIAEPLASHFDTTIVRQIWDSSEYDLPKVLQRYQITDVLILLFSDRMMYNLYGDMYLDRLLTPQS